MSKPLSLPKFPLLNILENMIAQNTNFLTFATIRAVIHQGNLSCLLPKQWFGDEIINAYLSIFTDKYHVNAKLISPTIFNFHLKEIENPDQ